MPRKILPKQIQEVQTFVEHGTTVTTVDCYTEAIRCADLRKLKAKRRRDPKTGDVWYLLTINCQ